MPRVGPQRCRTAVVPLLIGRNPDSVLELVSGGSVRLALRSHPDRRAEESVRSTVALGLDAALEEIEKNKEVLYGLEAADACPRLFSEERSQFGG